MENNKKMSFISQAIKTSINFLKIYILFGYNQKLYVVTNSEDRYNREMTRNKLVDHKCNALGPTSVSISQQTTHLITGVYPGRDLKIIIKDSIKMWYLIITHNSKTI